MFCVVSTKQLTRQAERLAFVLRRIDKSVAWRPSKYAANIGLVRNRAGVVFLGASSPAQLVSKRVKARFNRFDVQWGFTGHQAVILVYPSQDVDSTLAGVEALMGEIEAVASEARKNLDILASPTEITGPQLAGLYLDHNLPVPSQTMSARQIDFSAERLLWERQHTLGIAHFLAYGFDEFRASLTTSQRRSVY